MDIGEAQVAETKATLQQIASEIAMEESTSSTPKASMIGRGIALIGSDLEQEFVRLVRNTTHRFQK